MVENDVQKPYEQSQLKQKSGEGKKSRLRAVRVPRAQIQQLHQLLMW